MTEWVAGYVERVGGSLKVAPSPQTRCGSATAQPYGEFDVVCTDPPYYDAIPYSDLMDFFHVWLRRVLLRAFLRKPTSSLAMPLGPKWDQRSRAMVNSSIDAKPVLAMMSEKRRRRNYEDGMALAFTRFHAALTDDGRLVIVFANKQPDAWETLGVGSRSGLVSW